MPTKERDSYWKQPNGTMRERPLKCWRGKKKNAILTE